MNVLIACFFAANAAAHIVSYRQLAAKQASNAGGVMLFVVINAVLAVLVGLDLSWAKWPALIFPAVGGLGLTVQTLLPRKGTPIDVTILGLDVATVALVLLGLIL